MDRKEIIRQAVLARKLTRAQASKLGWNLTRGAHQGTTDDRIDRWYWDRRDSDVIDRTGAGFDTVAQALDWLLANVLLHEVGEEQ